MLRAIDRPTIDHRGPEFAVLGKTVLAGIKRVFQTEHDVVIYPASGTGAWEAALVNTLSPGDRVLMAETGHFATLWKKLAERMGLAVDFMPGDWRQGANPAEIEKRLRADAAQAIKAVCIVHNETSTGVTRRSRRFARRSIASDILHCCWSTRSRRSARSITGTTNGVSTSPSAARRKD